MSKISAVAPFFFSLVSCELWKLALKNHIFFFKKKKKIKNVLQYWQYLSNPLNFSMLV